MSKLNLPIEDPDSDQSEDIERMLEALPQSRRDRNPRQTPAVNPMDSPDAAVHRRFIALMTAALENPAGVRIKRASKNDAISLRHRLYRARRWYRHAGFTSLEKLTIRLEEKAFTHYVYILPETPLELELL